MASLMPARLLIAASAVALPCAAAAQTVTLPAVSTVFGTQLPALPSANDGVAYEIGTVIRPSSDGTIEALRFWKSPKETGHHVGHLWDFDTKALLATATYQGGAASGWQEVALTVPVPLSAGHRYVVTVNSNGFYPDTLGGLASSVGAGYLGSAIDTPNGVYGPPATFPTQSYQSSAYFVDAKFRVAQSLYAAQTPDLPDASDGVPYELGTRFVPATDGSVIALRYWKSPSETGAHVGNIWSDSGLLMASVPFGTEGASGWQSVALPQALRLHHGRTYVVSVNSNGHYADTHQGLAAPGIGGPWLRTSTDGRNGVYGTQGQFPTQTYQASSYFRDVVFQPVTTTVTVPAPAWTHRGWLGWIRDLASQPGAPGVYWPNLAIDDALIADYAQAGPVIRQAGATEVEIWGIAAGGYAGSPGYADAVETTASPLRVQQVKTIIQGLHAQGLKVLAGMGGMSWGFDQIVAAHPELGCPNSPYVANPLLAASWDYQDRIIDYLMSFGVDGITVQSGDQGRCAVPGLTSIASDVDYHARIVDRIAQYIRGKYPSATIGSANYGISFANPSDLLFVQQMTAHLDYVIDVGNTAQQQDPTYRARLVAAIAPAQFGGEADPAVFAPVHFAHDQYFLPTFQHEIANLVSLYADGGRASENYMRTQYNPGDEVSGQMVLLQEAAPGSDWNANLATLLARIYQPKTTDAAARLRDVFVTAETAYFGHANSSNVTLDAYYDHADTGWIYLRDNMTPAGRAAYRAALVTLQAEAQGLVGDVGNAVRMQLVATCIGNVIAVIDTLPSS